MKLHLKNTFIEANPADSNLENTRRQVFEAAYSFVTPKRTKKPELIHVSEEMLANLGISREESNSELFLKVVTGNEVYPNTKPYAMAYGGHQFGHWAGQLGDGRAINLFEVEHQKQNWKVQLKGAGETPYSRSGDGLAVLRSSIREYLCSEAMHYLGVPTTRALSLSLTGDDVLRDMLYDGNSAYEKGAIVARVSPSFLRFGNYELFAVRNDLKNLKNLTDYTINTYFPDLGKPSKETYIKFFEKVAIKTLDLIMHWQRVGFVHGVMNTDNMSILGLTIDYGPYGWLEGFDFGWTPNTTDRQHKRYRYGNQPSIGLWNLYQLANALYPLIDEAAPLEAILEQYKSDYGTKSLIMMKEKLGLSTADEKDPYLIKDLEDLLQIIETDMTIFFRLLSGYADDSDIQEILNTSVYNKEELVEEIEDRWKEWFQRYHNRLEKESLSKTERKAQMDAVNPKYVLRNYMAQMAIDKADEGDYSLISEFFEMLKKPYDEQPEYEHWFAKRPEWARTKVGCSMLSCSS
ncbi:MAG: hypothetical protein CMB99_03990 [Flavobacteriaceae bacterium]|nr:hypothetical protein [Flavobacteriaceae bacterium]|tara:strand:+ start:48180 stop:49736 length:1557 start_codon:yes stop_codon:yes gene_type:complete